MKNKTTKFKASKSGDLKEKAKDVIEENTKENYPENVCVIRWSSLMDEGGIIKLFSRDCPNTKLKK